MRSGLTPLIGIALFFVCVPCTQAEDKPADKAPIPDKAAVTEAEKAIREMFKADYAKPAPADRAALADKLLSQGVEEQKDLPSKYVLLRDARDIAAATGDASELQGRGIGGDETQRGLDARGGVARPESVAVPGLSVETRHGVQPLRIDQHGFEELRQVQAPRRARGEYLSQIAAAVQEITDVDLLARGERDDLFTAGSREVNTGGHQDPPQSSAADSTGLPR